jgi:hypothetical protein
MMETEEIILVPDSVFTWLVKREDSIEFSRNDHKVSAFKNTKVHRRINNISPLP